jgi:hypothetical protein
VRFLNKLVNYSNSLQKVLTACKSNNINANMKKLLDSITNGTNTDDIINNLYKYV